MVNETENAGRIAIRSDEKEALQAFLEKNIYFLIFKKYYGFYTTDNHIGHHMKIRPEFRFIPLRTVSS